LEVHPDPDSLAALMRRPALAVFAVAAVLASFLPVGTARADGEFDQQSASTATLQQALRDKGFYRGPIDGSYGGKTQQAVMAFRKEIGVTRSFSWSSSLWDELELYHSPYTRFDEPDRLEVNLTRQTAYLFRDGQLKGIFPVASGNGEPYANLYGNIINAYTPTGSFSLFRREYGWYYSYLGALYNPWFFYGGYALHGSNDVPAYPASHGCIRFTTWDSDYLNRHLFMGMRVHVWHEPSDSPGPRYESDGPFADVPTGHFAANAVTWMVEHDYTNGCRPYFFCPGTPATRGEVAVFIKRVLGPHLGPAPPASFTDTDGHTFESAISWLAGHRITLGCNPPDYTRFCPDRTVTRGEMSALFKRAVDHLILVDEASIDPSHFGDTQDSLFSTSTAWLAATGITTGCNPPANDLFCPDKEVSRAEIAVFLKRIVDRI
jgi:N-acetylmuramoyl-L-alanine amidase